MRRYFLVLWTCILALMNCIYTVSIKADQLPEDAPTVITESGMPKLMLPKSLNEFIQKHKKDLGRVPSKEDMTGRWADYSKKDAVPYATWGDFNGDGLTDVAFIFLESTASGPAWNVTSFHQAKNSDYQPFILQRSWKKKLEGLPPSQHFFLSTLKAGGKIHIKERALDYTYPHDSIVLSSFEGNTSIKIIFGWNPKHGVYRKTVLDRVGVQAAITPVETDLPRVVMEGDRKKLLLPKALEMAIELDIKSEYPEVRIPTAEDMIGDWTTYKRKNSVPYATWGDFNGDGLKDIAIILIGNMHWLVVAFHQTDNGSYEPFLVERFHRYKTKEEFKHHLYGFYLITFTAKDSLDLGFGPIRFEQDSIGLFSFPEGRFASGEIFEWAEKYNFYSTRSIGMEKNDLG